MSHRINIVLTTGTVTSRRWHAKGWAKRVNHQYVPLDLKPR